MDTGVDGQPGDLVAHLVGKEIEQGLENAMTRPT